MRSLRRSYPDAGCTLDYGSPFELLVATILSAQCTDERVNKVTPALFRRYPGPEKFARARTETLEREIRSTGFFRNKAKSIKGAAQAIVKEHEGEVPRSMEELVALPGVARKTANVVLGTAYGKAVGIAVDTHVFRVSRRLGLARGRNPEEVERELMELFPRSRWIWLSHALILHGRSVCHARRPACGECTLAGDCPSREE